MHLRCDRWCVCRAKGSRSSRESSSSSLTWTDSLTQKQRTPRSSQRSALLNPKIPVTTTRRRFSRVAKKFTLRYRNRSRVPICSGQMSRRQKFMKVNVCLMKAMSCTIPRTWRWWRSSMDRASSTLSFNGRAARLEAMDRTQSSTQPATPSIIANSW